MKTDFKVLMTLMSMEIGGAETHVLELCKGLKLLGVEVYVASNGGAYAQELKKSGIKHFEVPMHNKNILNMIFSYFELKKIITRNKIRLVHAHARIPAFLCGLLQKKLDFRLVTTCHGVFSTSLPFKILSNWGESTIAVSLDIEKYLTDNYGIPSEKIVPSMNGINTAKFSPATDYSSVAREYSMNPAKKRIVYICRLDEGNCDIAYKLLDCIVAVHDAYKNNIELFIVGGGTEYCDIRDKAREINNSLGTKLIVMTGARIDVNKFVAAADIVIAISRAALEALSTEKPVILAGNPGYIGIFDETKLDVSIKTNFSCRGCEPVTSKNLYDDLIKLLDMYKKDMPRIKEMGAFGRSVVCRFYSVDKMVESAMELYKKVLKSTKKIDAVVSGYYGFNNQGDDAVLRAIIDDLRHIKPDIRIIILSMHPSVTRRDYGVDSIHRLNVLKILKVLKNTTLLISGGGSLIQDLTSTKSLFYYIYIINAAKKRRAKVMLYANGIGPVRKEHNKRLTAASLNNADLITLRDTESAKVLKTLGVTKPPILVTADAAFGIMHTSEGYKSAVEKLRELGINAVVKTDTDSESKTKIVIDGRKYFCVSIRSWKYLRSGFEDIIQDFCEYMRAKYNYTALFIPMQPANDEEISKRIVSRTKICSHYAGSCTMDEILGIMEKSEFVLGMRLHSIIYAAKVGTPFIGLVYDPKVQAMMDSLNQKFYCKIDSLSADKLKSYADFVVFNREIISENLYKLSLTAEEDAMLNAKMAIGLLEADCF